MAKYKIIKEFVLNGVIMPVNTVVELDYKMANLRSIQENIESVDINTPLGAIKEAPQTVVQEPKTEAVPAPAETIVTPKSEVVSEVVTPAPVSETEALAPMAVSFYKVKEPLNVEGVDYQIGSLVSLSDEKAVELADKIESIGSIETNTYGSIENNA